jgi:hypothetical protein
MNLTNWLRKTPQPATVVADGQRIDVPKNARAYRDLTATIKSLEPSKLTCLDAKGDVIRSIVLESEDDKPASASAEMSDLQLFAKLLADGYERGAKTNQPLIDSAMNFCERQGQRLAKAEAEIERLRVHIHKLNLQLAEFVAMPEAPAGDDSIMGALVAGAMQAMPGGGGVTPIKHTGAKK